MRSVARQDGLHHLIPRQQRALTLLAGVGHRIKGRVMTMTASHFNPNDPFAASTSYEPSAAPESGTPWSGYHLNNWLVEQRNNGITPDVISRHLIDAGWSADHAATTSIRSLRSSDRQSLVYAVLTIATGIGVMALGSAFHLMLSGNPQPTDLAFAWTVGLVALPIALTLGFIARKLERGSRFVMWSASRRAWFGTGVIGIFRLITYVYSAIAILTGASTQEFTARTVGQIATSMLLAIPLFVWSVLEWRRSNVVISALSNDEG